MNTKPDALIAETFGMFAFAKGIKATPALDAEFNKFLFRTGCNNKRVLAEQKAWAKGWHKANLA
jgi:hypothetical protein